MTLATVLVALALAPVLSGMGGDARPRDPTGAGEMKVAEHQRHEPTAADASQDSPADEAQSCEWSCRACEPDQGCRQMCTEIGDCGSTCGVTARCDAQHKWSDEACACVDR